MAWGSISRSRSFSTVRLPARFERGCAVDVHDQREMPERWHRMAKSFEQLDLCRCVGHMILAPNDAGHAKLTIIHG